MNKLAELFVTFAKVGVMTFGGGYAMLPILEREVCENKHWSDQAELMDYYAIGQCTPGVIAVNVSTFLGGKIAGTIGAVAATAGMVFPSLVIITIIAALISNFSELMWVQNAFAGIRVCVCVLIFNAVIKLWKAAVIDKTAFVIFALVLLGSVFLSVSPVVYVVLAAIAGIALQVKKIPDKQKKAE